MTKRKLPRNVYRRRGHIEARLQINGSRVRIGRWPDNASGLAAAEAAVRQAKRDAEDGVWVEPNHLTVRQYTDVWMERRERQVALGQLRRSTWISDRDRLADVLPQLGSVRLSDLTRDHVERLAVELLLNGGARGQGLAPQTVHSRIAALKVMLSGAVRDDLLTRNPAAGVAVQRTSTDVDFDDLATWTPKELATFISSIDGVLRQLVVIAASTGVRRSELIRLQWPNVDLDEGIVRIRATVINEHSQPVWLPQVKSAASRRSIALPTNAVGILRQRKADQAAEKLSMGRAWSNPLDLVWTWPDGSMIKPNWFTNAMRRESKRVGLVPIGPHGLRHTFATISLENGVPLKNVSEALGHANIGVTADVYSHVTEQAAREAAEVVGRAIFGAST